MTSDLRLVAAMFIAVGVALLGVVAGCIGNEPDVPRAGPTLTADTRHILGSEAFVAFADEAHLDKTLKISVARTLALHFENAAAIQATDKGADAQSSMHRQLLADTVAHLRAQIPVGSWDEFTRSGLLPEIAPVASTDRTTRGRTKR